MTKPASHRPRAKRRTLAPSPLQRARSHYRAAREAQDPDMIRIWRGYRWALLADLYLARGDARGVARCVARVDGAGGQP